MQNINTKAQTFFKSIERVHACQVPNGALVGVAQKRGSLTDSHWFPIHQVPDCHMQDAARLKQTFSGGMSKWILPESNPKKKKPCLKSDCTSSLKSKARAFPDQYEFCQTSKRIFKHQPRSNRQTAKSTNLLESLCIMRDSQQLSLQISQYNTKTLFELPHDQETFSKQTIPCGSTSDLAIGLGHLQHPRLSNAAQWAMCWWSSRLLQKTQSPQNSLDRHLDAFHERRVCM